MASAGSERAERRPWPVLLLTAVMALGAIDSACAQAPDNSAKARAGDPVSGQRKADDERCVECHGERGDVPADNEAGRLPRLAGQRPAYLLKQLRDFASGARHHEFMNRVAADLDLDDAADILAFYVSQPPIQVVPSEGQVQDFPLARQIYAHGDPERAIPACASCHGADGRSSITGTDIAVDELPVIAGQDRHYLLEQLFNWRSGERANSPGGIMNRAVQGLKDEEIRQLAEYLESL